MPPISPPSWSSRSTARAGLADLFDDTRLGTVVIGPGLGVGFETRELVETALAGPPWRKLVLDADALSSFADDPEALFNRLRPGVGRADAA